MGYTTFDHGPTPDVDQRRLNGMTVAVLAAQPVNGGPTVYFSARSGGRTITGPTENIIEGIFPNDNHVFIEGRRDARGKIISEHAEIKLIDFFTNYNAQNPNNMYTVTGFGTTRPMCSNCAGPLRPFLLQFPQATYVNLRFR